MFSILLVTFLAVVTAGPSTKPWAELRKSHVLKFEPIDELEKLWNDFKQDHNKWYETIEEELQRKDMFHQNVKRINMHNSLYDHGIKSFKLGVNEYTDMGPGEFFKMMNGYKMSNKSVALDRATYMSPSNEYVTLNLPDKVDWRDKGYVTAVKNQGECGSCWSFSTTGSLEGQNFKKTGTLTSLSEQNLVDCSEKWGNNGCEGGLMDYAFQYIKDNDGLDTEESYPYKAKEGKCHYKKKNVGATDIGYTDMPEGDELKLKEALSTVGPISIAIDASHSSFQLYKSGVYDEPECSSSQLDHGVLLVGYGTEEGSDYWLVKNSWGETWGEDGYIKMSRNKENQCGVATSASYPMV